MKHIAIIVTLLATLALPAVAEATRLPSFEGASRFGGLLVKPGGVWISGDGSYKLAGYSGLNSRIHWTSWTSTAAYGNGVAWLNDCNPYCAAGTFHGWRIVLQAYRPAWVDGMHVFTRLTIRYPYGIAPYQSRTHTKRVVATYEPYAGGHDFYYN